MNPKTKIFVITLLSLCSSLLYAEIIKDDKYITGQSEFSFKEACKFLTQKESPLIDYVSVSTLNCMGKKLKVAPFCDDKEAANPYYIRAVVDQKSKKVKCLSSKKVILKYKCEGEKDKFCKDPEIGCFLFKEQLAKRLKVAYQSLGEEGILNCYFDVRVNMNIVNED